MSQCVLLCVCVAGSAGSDGYRPSAVPDGGAACPLQPPGRGAACPLQPPGRGAACPLQPPGRGAACPLQPPGRGAACPLQPPGRGAACPLQPPGRGAACPLADWSALSYRELSRVVSLNTGLPNCLLQRQIQEPRDAASAIFSAALQRRSGVGVENGAKSSLALTGSFGRSRSQDIAT